jgi:hypothetical protein
MGADIDKNAVGKCGSLGLDVVRCDIFSLPLRDSSCDGLLFSHVIEHIPSDCIHKLLIEIRRVSNNRVVVVTPTEHSKFWTKGHVVAYTKNKLANILSQEGYNVSKVCYDKCFMLGLKDSGFLLKFFNHMPFIWLKMNIIAVANTGGKQYSSNDLTVIN